MIRAHDHLALLRFRATESQILWADVTCFDHSSIPEMNQMVYIMGNMYEKALVFILVTLKAMTLRQPS